MFFFFNTRNTKKKLKKIKPDEDKAHLVDHLVARLHIPTLLTRCRRVWVFCTPRPDINNDNPKQGKKRPKNILKIALNGK